MPPRFDESERRLSLSVADLLERDAAGSLGFANRGGRERLWIGQAIHGRYQEERMAVDATYQREVPIEHTSVHRGWSVHLAGRIDGLRRDEAGQVIEEIKSVRHLDAVRPAVLEVYCRQASIYAWMLAQLAAGPVRAELVLIEIGSGRRERQAVEVEPKEIAGSVLRQLNRLLRDWESRRQARDDRHLAATALRFPFPELRRGQQEIVDGVEQALRQRENLLVEAPTGIGKTVAALYPVLRYALAHDKKVFVLTAKNTQQDMAARVVRLLNQAESFSSLRLRAKAAMCANGEVICHEEYCRFAKDYFQKLARSRLVPELLHDYAALEPETIFERAGEAELCPFEVSLELARQASVVIGDYNYAFDPYVALSHFGFDQDLSDTILLVDEIHNLVDRARDYYSPELLEATALQVAADRRTHPLADEIAAVCEDLARIVRQAAADALPPGNDDASAEAAIPEDALWEMQPEISELLSTYLEHQRETRSIEPDDKLVSLFFDLQRFLTASTLVNGSEFTTYVERRQGHHRLHILCCDAGRLLAQTHSRCHSLIGLSATLSPPEFFQQALGLDAERSSSLRLPSPFPEENRRIVIDTSVATTYRQRAKNYPRIAESLDAFLAAVPGNCLALFPSYEFLRQIAERLHGGGRRVLVQRPDAGAREREDLLEQLRSSLFDDVVLLAVAGGVFSEGVDYPGRMLRGVAIVGPCLPGLSLERQLLKRYYDERFERGFEYAFVVPGMTRVVQAAGRLIRSSEDTGVIALFDRRFLQRPYATHLPEHWLEGREAVELRGDPAEAAAKFFAREAAVDTPTS